VRITEVRIKLMDRSDDRLQAFCSITLDDAFVVRDLKIIEGSSGPFVAMPSRKLMAHCPDCGFKNHLRAGYCNQCGFELPEESLARDQEGRAKLYADIAHPVNAECREMIQSKVIQEFQAELERAKQPGYVSRYDDEYPGDGSGQPVNGVKHSSEAVAKSVVKVEESAPPAVGNHRIEAAEPAAQGPHRAAKEAAGASKRPGPRSKTSFGEGIF
jgi:stage V sporulation protein G